MLLFFRSEFPEALPQFPAAVRDGMEAASKLNGDRMEIAWRLNGDSMEIEWRLNGDSMEIVWRLNGDSMEIVWRWHGDSIEIVSRLRRVLHGDHLEIARHIVMEIVGRLCGQQGDCREIVWPAGRL